MIKPVASSYKLAHIISYVPLNNYTIIFCFKLIEQSEVLTVISLKLMVLLGHREATSFIECV